MTGGGMLGLQVKWLIPIGVQGSLRNARGLSLLAIDGSNGKGVGET
jgi:hypothetical protein